ncbi:hypothetical protein [Streptomyces cinereoruber]|uniref:hypothetical protein n=1 Tax=Streptomyces cinereoruber TaxID=67260 RepID=UPI00363AC1DE
MHSEQFDERLSDEELELFVQYLHRFANHDVHLFLSLEVGYPEHPLYVTLGRDFPRRGDDGLPVAVRRSVTDGIRI